MNLRKFSLRSTLEAEASDWLARRDRGLTPREQDAYLQWLREDERHPAAIARAEQTLRSILQLSAWRHEHSAEPNPDLLARPRRVHFGRWIAAAAAALVLAGVGVRWGQSLRTDAPSAVTRNYLQVNEHVVLPDGSRVELRDGSTLEVRYSVTERRVRLTGGEAQFAVMKSAARPFVVEAGTVAVRAIGTVFDVRLGGEAVQVLVTEGKVRVGRASRNPGEIFQSMASDADQSAVAAGERAVVSLAAVATSSVAPISAVEIRRELDWLAPRLHFDATPLAVAVAEFNRRNRHQLVIADPSLNDASIGGNFSPDNVDGFVRLLSITLGVQAESRGANETVLRRGP